MKKHVTVLILVALISSSILGGSALALTNSEAAPETPVEAYGESEAVVPEDSISQTESDETIAEEKEPEACDTLSPEARAKINDEFYEKLKNADDSESFRISFSRIGKPYTDEDVEKYASEKTGIDKDYYSSISGRNGVAPSNNYDTKLLLEKKTEYDAARTEFIVKRNTEASKAIFEEFNITPDEDTFVSQLSSCIFDIEATKEQILSLAASGKVCGIEEYFAIFVEDF